MNPEQHTPVDPDARPPLPVTPAEGVVVCDRYELLERVGTGGMGIVYAAHDRARDQRVALKTLHHLDPGALYRLKNEFRSAANLDHPNLVTFHELFSEREQWFVSMEYIEGVSFARHVAAEPDSELLDDLIEPDAPILAQPRSYRRLRSALRQLVDAVSTLHDAGIVHRDIKSSNVLVTGEGRVVVLDFGLASYALQRLIDHTQEDGILGTPGYMAPEQAAGAPATEASDWYSVGVMLYEALAGQLPYTGTALQIMTEKQRADPTPVASLAVDAPEDLCALCMDLLQRDPAARPTGASVLERVAGRSQSGSRAYLGLGPFVGRGDALEHLRAAREAADAGPPVMVFVRGRSGIGKTAVVERFLAELRGKSDAVILSGRCYERESVPYKAFDSLVDALTRYLRRLPRVDAASLMPRDIHELARVFPVLERVPAVTEVPRRTFAAPDHQELRRRAFRGLKELLGRISDRSPLVLHIGDLQWGDEDSARLLVDLLSPPEPPRMLLLITHRDEPARPLELLERLIAQLSPSNRPRADTITLGPLSPSDAERLALLRLGDEFPGASARARTIALESGGSPLYIEELVRHSARGREPQTRERSLDEVVALRLRSLAPTSRRLIELLAVAGRPIERALVAQAAGLERDRPAIHELRAANLVRLRRVHDAVHLECTHDRIREAVLTRVEEARVAELHRELARALEAAPNPDLETVAHHLHAAGELSEAARYALAAADKAAEALAFSRAARLYELAARWAPRSPEHARGLRIAQADALVHAGRCADAAPIYEQAASEAPAREAIELRRNAAEQYLVSGHLQDGARILRPLLVDVGLRYPETPEEAGAEIEAAMHELRDRGTEFTARPSAACSPEALARVDVSFTAGKGLAFIDPIRGYCFYLQSLRLALEHGTPGRIARGLASVGMVMMSRGSTATLREGAAYIRTAEQIADERGDPYLRGYTGVIAGIANVTVSRWRDAIDRLDESVELLQDRCAGVAWECSVAQMATLRALLSIGELEAVEACAHGWSRQSRDAGDVYGEVWAGLFGALPQLARDRPAELRAGVDAAISRWSREGFHFQHMLALVLLAYCDIYEGRPGDAHRRIEDAWPQLAASQILGWQFLRIFGLQARAGAAIAAARAEPSTAEPKLEAALEHARTLEATGDRRHDLVAAVAVIRAGVAAVRGHKTTALEHLDRAILSFEAAEMKLHAACARRRRGEHTGGSQGARMVDDADVAIARLGVLRPDRWAEIYAPGL